jgi:hypothetical protein
MYVFLLNMIQIPKEEDGERFVLTWAQSSDAASTAAFLAESRVSQYLVSKISKGRIPITGRLISVETYLFSKDKPVAHRSWLKLPSF